MSVPGWRGARVGCRHYSNHWTGSRRDSHEHHQDWLRGRDGGCIMWHGGENCHPRLSHDHQRNTLGYGQVPTRASGRAQGPPSSARLDLWTLRAPQPHRTAGRCAFSSPFLSFSVRLSIGMTSWPIFDPAPVGLVLWVAGRGCSSRQHLAAAPAYHAGAWSAAGDRRGRDHRPMARGRLGGQFARARFQRAYHAEKAPARSR